MIKSRNTRQKDKINQAMLNINGFFNAEDLLEKTNDKNIGMATIYRFLKVKSASREIHSYRCDGRTIYSNSKQNHSHFICQKCGNIAHIKVENLDFLKKNINGTACHFQLDVYGLCEKCNAVDKHPKHI